MQETLARHVFDQLRLSTATDDLLAVRAGRLAATRVLARSASEVIDAKRCEVEVCDRLLLLRLSPEQRAEVNERRNAARDDLLAAARSLAVATTEIAEHERQERCERGRVTLRVRAPGFILYLRMPRYRTARPVRMRRCTARVSQRAKHVARTATRATAGPDGDSDPERPSAPSPGGNVGLGRAVGQRGAGFGRADAVVVRIATAETRTAVDTARIDVRREVSP